MIMKAITKVLDFICDIMNIPSYIFLFLILSICGGLLLINRFIGDTFYGWLFAISYSIGCIYLFVYIDDKTEREVYGDEYVNKMNASTYDYDENMDSSQKYFGIK